jgi:RNA polymerase sigma-70 factor (ECF subfamily)
MPVPAETPDDLIAIDDALRALTAQNERKAQVVELRFFGGLSVEETADVLQIFQEAVMRDWKFAKNWLMRELIRKNRLARRR